MARARKLARPTPSGLSEVVHRVVDLTGEDDEPESPAERVTPRKKRRVSRGGRSKVRLSSIFALMGNLEIIQTIARQLLEFRMLVLQLSSIVMSLVFPHGVAVRCL